MGSTLAQLRTLLESQIESGVTDSNSNPSSTILNTYITKAIRKIAIDLKPRELMSSIPENVNIVVGQNTAAFPTTLYIPTSVWYKDSNNNYKQLIPINVKDMVIKEGASNFFNPSNIGNPSYYSLGGSNLVLNRYFDRTETGAIKVFGIKHPTTLSDSTECDLSEDYDLLITYFAAYLYYQKDEDIQSMQNYLALYNQEKQDLLMSLDWNYEQVIELNPNIFGGFNSSDRGDVMMNIGA